MIYGAKYLQELDFWGRGCFVHAHNSESLVEKLYFSVKGIIVATYGS